MPINIEHCLLYRDALMLVLNKPANIAVHQGFGEGETLNSYFQQLQFGLPHMPQLAHRLDRATTGCLVLGRHKQALKRLSHLFESGQIEKTYLAVVLGEPQEKHGTIDLPLAKQSKATHRWWMKVDENGQTTRTDYRVLASKGNVSLVELSPKTGRTHQLRVHMAAIGHPILGEWMYQGDAIMPNKTPLQLHARSVRIPYHDKKPPVFVEAPLPEHMENYLRDAGLAVRTPSDNAP